MKKRASGLSHLQVKSEMAYVIRKLMERAGIKGYDFLLTSYKKILSNDAYEKIKKSF